MKEMRIVFRCPKELEGLLPVPGPASESLPGWLKSMPAEAFSRVAGAADDTVKRCPPFLDAMTAGFVMPLICDVRVEQGEFTWQMDLPPSETLDFPRSPLGFHDPAQVLGTPLADPDQILLKFHNPWAIEAPEGYSILFTHPANRHDLPFTTLTGLVDCDGFSNVAIHFPARWRDPSFQGVLPRGTPVAQCIPVKRERWKLEIATMEESHSQAAQATLDEIRRERGVYRRRFRA